MNILVSLKNLTKFEWGLWIFSLLVISISFFAVPGGDGLSFTASLIGVTALIFVAKGDCLGQILTVIFSLFYAVVSWVFRYYSELITYLGMTAPMAALAVISWLKNPFEGKKQEVKVNHLTKKEWVFTVILTGLVTLIFYYILKHLRTPNLAVSTASITTSFLASYLTFRRSPFYALAYAGNDLILIILWVIAVIKDISYLSMVMCFIIFFVNDVYGFINWTKMKKRQNK